MLKGSGPRPLLELTAELPAGRSEGDVTTSTGIRDDVELEIERLREEKNAVILAHYYQHADIQDIADFVGDSLALSRQAAKTDKDVIVFCGVRFMADSSHVVWNKTRTNIGMENQRFRTPAIRRRAIPRESVAPPAADRGRQ